MSAVKMDLYKKYFGKTVVIQLVVIVVAALANWFTISVALPVRVSALETKVETMQTWYREDLTVIRSDIKKILRKI